MKEFYFNTLFSLERHIDMELRLLTQETRENWDSYGLMMMMMVMISGRGGGGGDDGDD